MVLVLTNKLKNVLVYLEFIILFYIFSISKQIQLYIFSGIWAHGDFCEISPQTGGIVMLGRRYEICGTLEWGF